MNRIKLLTFCSWLSTAGSSMTLIAITSDLFITTGNSSWSASVQTISLLAAALVGLLSGKVFSSFSVSSIGVVSSFLSFIVSVSLVFLAPIHPEVGLAAIFILFFFSGISEPNFICLVNHIVKEENRIKAFSLIQSGSLLASFLAPVVGGFIVKYGGSKICYNIDAISFFIVSIVWMYFSKKKIDPPKGNSHFLAGFKSIYESKDLQKLTFSRLVNNVSFITFSTCLPIWISGMVNESDFSFYLGLMNTLTIIGFLILSFSGASGKINNNNLYVIVPFVSIFAVVGVMSSIPNNLYLLGIGAIFLGFANFAGRISGITIGQFVTPRNVLGPVIAAGDAINRSISFIISLLVIQMSSKGFVLVVFCLISLFSIAPLVSLAKKMREGSLNEV